MEAPEKLLDALPPQNLDAERCVLGGLLLDSSRRDEVLAILKPTDFYTDAHAKLFGHLAAMHNDNRPIDVKLLVERLRQAGDLEAIGGMTFLAEVAHAIPVTRHVVRYAEIVREKSTRRKILRAAAAMLDAANDPTAEVEGIVSKCEGELQQVATGEYVGEPVEFAEALHAACADVDEIIVREQSAGVMIGLENFDLATGGLFPGELTILAARPSIGKTSLALQVAKHVALKGRRAYVASLEMRTTELALRMLCGESGVSLARVRSAKLDQADRTDLAEATAVLGNMPIVLHDRAGLTVQDIRRACRRLAADKPLSLVVVDYLQRVTPADKRRDRHLQVGQIAWDLKAMALELQVPVLCLCQLSRAAEERNRKTGHVNEPRMSHLKESGDLEQDADVVLLLHRQPRANEAIMILAKNRQGEQARFNLEWDGGRMQFSCGMNEWKPLPD